MSVSQLSALSVQQGVSLKPSQLIYLGQDQKNALQSKTMLASKSGNLFQIMAMMG